MRVKVFLEITDDDGSVGGAAEVAVFEKQTERPEDLGLSIAEGKVLTAAIQQHVVDAQVATWAERRRRCEACGARRHSKGSHPVTFMTLYGDVGISSPRLHRCPCQGAGGPATMSPLRDLIPNHVSPERLYLEARWSSLVPYAAAAGLLADVLPIESGANATTLREHTLRVAERVEAELEEERSCFIDGCPADWARLPIPEGRIVVGLMPGGSPGHDPDQAFVAAIPAGDLEPPPARFAINEALGEGRLAGPDDPAVKSAAPLLYHALVRWLPHQPNG